MFLKNSMNTSLQCKKLICCDKNGVGELMTKKKKTQQQQQHSLGVYCSVVSVPLQMLSQCTNDTKVHGGRGQIEDMVNKEVIFCCFAFFACPYTPSCMMP
jgi:hypothetical protein